MYMHTLCPQSLQSIIMVLKNSVFVKDYKVCMFKGKLDDVCYQCFQQLTNTNLVTKYVFLSCVVSIFFINIYKYLSIKRV